MGSAESLAGLRVLITAGPTREAIDPVRYISNRSSGKMGFAVARAARDAGARVTLVAGPVNRRTPKDVWRVNVESAEEMLTSVSEYVPETDIFVATAAVADFRPRQVADQKLKKNGETLTLKMVRNPDILATVAAIADGPFTVGFAAETENLARNAREKLISKNLDMIAANKVGRDEAFDKDRNALLVIWNDGEQQLPKQGKLELAHALINCVARRYRESRATRARV